NNWFQIVNDKKTYSKDERIAACEQLQQTLTSASDVANISYDWRKLVEDLLYCIKTRQQIELKRYVSDCLGSLGCIMFSQYNEYLKLMLNEAKLIPDKYEDDKSLILKAVFSSLNLIGTFAWQSRIRPQDVDALMTAMKNWLEVNDSSVVLISLLDICLVVSKYFPTIFKRSFDDVVDFTVGWYIEPEQSTAVLDKCHEMLVELRPYWHSEIPSTITLMKQFLDDASAYIEDIKGNEAKPENKLSKTAAILRALITMLEIMNIPVNPLVADFAEKVFGRIIRLLAHLNDVFTAKIGTVFGYMAEVLCITLKTYPKLDFLVNSMKALKIMLEHPSVDEKMMLKILGCNGKIIDSVTPKMVVEIVDYVVGDDGPLNHVITRSQEVMQAYGSVLGKLLAPKNLSTLQVAYNRVRRDVRNCLNMLQATEVEAYCSDSLMIEKKLMIYFNALYSLGIVKNSLIAMMGLSPSLFAFLMTETPITRKEFIINHPGCHYALLYIVKMHSEKHENFVANSSLLINKSSLTLVAESATAKHTTAILNVVTKLLALDDLLWIDTRNLLIDWIHGLVFSLTPDVLQHILDKPEIIEMRTALLDSFVRHSLPKKTPLDNKILCNPEAFVGHGCAATTSHRVRHFTLLRRLAVFNLVKNGRPEITAKFVKRVFEQCYSGCQNKITGIWQATPPVLFISNGLTECAQDLMEFGQQKISESLFTPEHFRTVADFLLNSVLPTYCFNSIDDGNWLSDTAATIYADAVGGININSDCISKWRWIVAQMAQFCVNNRLKTPLGKPLDTFLAFENEIRRLSGSALSRKLQPVGKGVKDEVIQKTVTVSRRGIIEDEDEAEVEVEREARQLTTSEQWWRVRALLDMIEMLDKLIVYACRGAVFQLSTVSQLSQQFLMTNQASCANWLSRLYLPMMAVAYTSNNFAQVVRLGSCSLRDIEKRIEEKGNKDSVGEKVEIDSVAHTCITWMVKALIDLGRPQAILGLYAWVKKIYGKQYVWIKCAAQMAAGRIEPALNGLQKCLRYENLSENIQKTIRQLIIFGLEVLRNSEEIDVFWRMLYGVLDPKPDELPGGFEEFTWKRMKSLTTFDNCLRNESLVSVPWDMRNSFVHTELKLMDIIHDRFRDSKDNKTDVVDLTRQLSEDARILMLADTNLQTFTRASALHLLATAVKDSRKPYHKQSVTVNVVDPSFLFDWKNGPPIQRLIIGQQLSTWLQHTQTRENGGCSSLRVISNEAVYHLEMARLARKTKNYRLAEKHIKIHYNKRLPTLDNFQLSILRGMQGNWISGAFDKENKLAKNVAVQLPMQQRLYNFEDLVSSYGFSKMMWAISETADTVRARTFLQGKAFSLLMNAVSDEIDRLIYKSNLMFNGTPTVAPDALIAVLTQHFNHSVVEDSALLSIGPNVAASNQQQLEQNKVSAKAIIQLARWLQMESSLLPVAMSHSMRIAFHIFGAEQSQLPLLGPSGIADSLAGALLSTSCKLSPHLAKAHLELGNWAFKRAIDADNEIRLSFISEEYDAMKWHIKNTCTSVEDSLIENLLQTVQKSTSLAAISSDCKTVVGNAISEQICDVLFGPRSMIQEIWKGANSRHLAFCNYAAHSYFAYIAASGRETKEGTIGVVMATLRILQLLVKQYDALHHLILNEMLQVNELMWKDILPQLFARLNHPVRAVRDTLCTILERIAATSPHAVCYPAIVGATQPIVIHNEYVDNGEVEKSDFVDVIDEEKKERADQDRSLMFECCQRIVTRMQALFPDLVKDVTEFVKELQRIDMLHEERWTFVLTNLDLEMNRRILQIETEMMKTLMNAHLNDDEKKEIIHEKTVIFTSLVYRIIENLYEKTCTSVPVTVNEKQFQDTYLTTIEEAIKTLRLKRSEPRQAWASFKLVISFFLMTLENKYNEIVVKLLAQLNQRANRRSFVCLQMADISPRLAALNKTHVPLPGQEHKNFSDVVMLERISKQAVILPTKTRPRKVIFHGSDGKEWVFEFLFIRYPFLFKGQEDLHLDERIMQLLRICNLMLLTKETDWPSYIAENYSVIPLGSRSGLIEWVEGATPIFQVYRKWQLRQAAENISVQKINEVERPSALFFKKLKAAFQANKIPKESITDRQKWPLSILKGVVEDLIEETPRDLLSRELWLRAGSSDTWFRVTERFARSTAVMSVVGSILGLGDRHLDNVLVNFEFGHVVHIDYNVCFDKGRNLRVPEMVPFRLTGNIVRALGPTDVEGTFRLSSENVLGKLRAGKEILLTMLDAFVYDPLVDWAAAQDDLGSRSMIGIATIIAVYGVVDSHSDILHSMALSLFALRIRELSPSWFDNKDYLKRMLKSIVSILGKLYESAQKDVKSRPQNWEEEINKLEMEKLSIERNLKNAVTEHHSMMHDIRPLLRSFAHASFYLTALYVLTPNFFLLDLIQFDPLIKGLKLLDDSYSSANVCIDLFRSVIDNIPSIYDSLLLLEKVRERMELPFHTDKSLPVERHEGQQQQNLHGKHVSKKVRMKLEGMITASINKNGNANIVSEPLTPSEQVDLLIQQATDISNLALMYEGWTAWV
uniref:non-specific serine/threonine protein kinase n=1 Tax=Elaeophora elaphi TaxID=1147741 RepID=A0A0R3RSZ9_9BILA